MRLIMFSIEIGRMLISCLCSILVAVWESNELFLSSTHHYVVATSFAKVLSMLLAEATSKQCVANFYVSLPSSLTICPAVTTQRMRMKYAWRIKDYGGNFTPQVSASVRRLAAK